MSASRLPKELDLRIGIVHGCFLERGDSTLNVLGGKLLQVSYLTSDEFYG